MENLQLITREQVIEGLKQAYDPELNLDVYTLGLIYKIEIKGAEVKLLMTFTTPMCPYGPMLMDEVRTKVKATTNAKDVTIELTFEPLWQPSEEVKMMLGMT